jgi:hypothetical protein
MKKEALSAGYYRSQGWGRDYPRMQIFTVEQLLHGPGRDATAARHIQGGAEGTDAGVLAPTAGLLASVA